VRASRIAKGAPAHERATERADLTPTKDAAAHLDTYFRELYALKHPHALISLGFLGTHAELMRTSGRYRRMIKQHLADRRGAGDPTMTRSFQRWVRSS
jgi:hypothetical protein